jgi:hypothetical protein
MSRFKGHFRELGDVSREGISSVTEKIAHSSQLWRANDHKFSADFPGNHHIVFKFPYGYAHSHLQASYTDLWCDWQSLLAPIIQTAVRYYGFAQFETCKVMLSRLIPGAHIPRHVDTNPSSAIPHKIHVPLITNPDVVFFVEDVQYTLSVGKAYELNNLLPHSVENRSDSDRVHFIFDVYSTDG